MITSVFKDKIWEGDMCGKISGLAILANARSLSGDVLGLLASLNSGNICIGERGEKFCFIALMNYSNLLLAIQLTLVSGS